jgi:hypothetical protein
MSYTELFYWLTVADNAKTFFGTFAIFFTLVFIITQCVRIFSSMEGVRDEDGFYKKCNVWTWYSTPFMLFFLSAWIFTPNKRDALLIIAGGQTIEFLTTDESAKQIPHELSNFVVSELKNMAKDAKVDLGIKESKETIIEQAKKMTGDELMQFIKDNPDYTEILLGKK